MGGRSGGRRGVGRGTRVSAVHETHEPRLVGGRFQGGFAGRSWPRGSKRRSATRGTPSWRKRPTGAREIECAVLGNDEPVASVAGEIVPKGHEFYDYEAKYLDEDGAQLLIPADLKPEVLEDVQRLAVAAFRTTRCAGMARVDFFLLGEDRLWLNEVNTIPGFTSISMYPKLWEVSGLPYAELVERLLDLAIERHEADRKSTGVRELGS